MSPGDRYDDWLWYRRYSSRGDLGAYDYVLKPAPTTS